jgi:starvation-inducible DNA-binding protein
MADNALDVDATETPIESGIDPQQLRDLADQLNRVLASTYVLNAKTQAVHWVISGPMFYSVHKLTEHHYEDMQDAIDDLAERIRALGLFPLSSLRAFLSKSVVQDMGETGTVEEMISMLAADHQLVARLAREAIHHAEDADDVFTADLLTERIGIHEKAAWMLKALRAH